MALADILEALTAGGSAGLSAYAREKELEQERAERERVRQEEARYRQQLLDFRKREEERAEADAEYQRSQDTERGLIEGRLREVRDIYNPAAVRQSVAGLEQEIGGFGKAPGQTYAARMMRQQEERPKSPLASALREEEPEVALEGMGRVSEELPSRLSFLSEVPEFEATESFRERGSRQYGDTAVRPVTPEEKAASERERLGETVARDRAILDRALAGDQDAVVEAYVSGLGDELQNLSTYINPEAPDAPDMPEKIQLYQYLRREYPDMPQDELLQRSGMGLPQRAGGAGGVGGDSDTGEFFITEADRRFIAGEVNKIVEQGVPAGQLPDGTYSRPRPYTPDEIEQINRDITDRFLAVGRSGFVDRSDGPVEPFSLFAPFAGAGTRVPYRPGYVSQQQLDVGQMYLDRYNRERGNRNP